MKVVSVVLGRFSSFNERKILPLQQLLYTPVTNLVHTAYSMYVL